MFYQKFANTPISDRFTPLNFNEAGMMTLNELYDRLHKLDDQIRPYILKQQKLLRLADDYYIFKKFNNSKQL